MFSAETAAAVGSGPALDLHRRASSIVAGGETGLVGDDLYLPLDYATLQLAQLGATIRLGGDVVLVVDELPMHWAVFFRYDTSNKSVTLTSATGDLPLGEALRSWTVQESYADVQSTASLVVEAALSAEAWVSSVAALVEDLDEDLPIHLPAATRVETLSDEHRRVDALAAIEALTMPLRRFLDDDSPLPRAETVKLDANLVALGALSRSPEPSVRALTALIADSLRIVQQYDLDGLQTDPASGLLVAALVDVDVEDSGEAGKAMNRALESAVAAQKDSDPQFMDNLRAGAVEGALDLGRNLVSSYLPKTVATVITLLVMRLTPLGSAAARFIGALWQAAGT